MDHFFRRDSDVYTPYGRFESILRGLNREGSGNITQDIERLVSDKKHLAIWIVSNCKSSAGALKRKALADALYKAGLALDRRGKCYSRYLKNKNAIKEYKFYLSFENSEHCTDYITEKFFCNSYRMGAVPVVWGAKKSDYEAIAPPHSFIFAEDYTVPELVRYLNYLNKNTTAYMEYFKWRTKKIESMPQYGRTIGYCNLCRIIHGINVDNIFNPNYPSLQKYIPLFGHPNRSRVVPSLNKWFYGNEYKECVKALTN